MSSIFYAGMIPFYLNTCVCIPDVMGSADWDYSTGGTHAALVYDVAGDYYWPSDESAQTLLWPTAFSGDQSIQATFSNIGTWTPQDASYMSLECRRTDMFYNGNGLRFVMLRMDPAVGDEWFWWVQYIYDPFTPAYEVYSADGLSWPFGDPSDPFTARLESDTDGAYRIYINGSLLTSGVVPGQLTGPSHMGLWMETAFGGGQVVPEQASAPRASDICMKSCDLTTPPTDCYSWEYNFPDLGNARYAPFTWELIHDPYLLHMPDGGDVDNDRDFYYLPSHDDPTYPLSMMQDGCDGYTATFEVFQIPGAIPAAMLAEMEAYVTTTALGPYEAQTSWQWVWAGATIEVSITLFYYWPLAIVDPDISFLTLWHLDFDDSFGGTPDFVYPQDGSSTTTHGIPGVYTITDAYNGGSSAIWASTWGIGAIEDVVGPMTMLQ